MMESITITTLAYGPIAPVWELARQTWEPYCARHDYDLHVESDLLDSSLAPSWNKCLLVARLLRDTGRPVWWIDADMTVANPSWSLTKLDEPWTYLNVSTDWNGYCFGMFRASPSRWTINFLEFIPMLGDVGHPERFGKGLGCKWEQNAIKLLALEFPNVDKHIGSLPKSWVNDNPHNPNPSDVIWHFGGRTMSQRLEMIRKAHPNL